MASVIGESATVNTDLTSPLEDLIIVWLDATIDDSNMIWSKRQDLLRSRMNYIRTFTEQDECLKYISTIQVEFIFLIISGSMSEIIVPEIHELPQISGIYIFCGDIAKHTQWSKLFPKVRGIFNDENPLMVCLEKDAKICLNTLLPINISHSDERSLQDIDDEQVAFLWFQLMIEVMYRLPQTLKSKTQMVDECRTHYEGNSAQLRMIEKFYNEYNANLAIDWYTKDSFVYRLLNKAFRTQNIDIIFNYHYYLSDLTKALTRLYLDQFGGKTGTLTVFRGQQIRIEEIQRLENSIGRLVSVNTFFSASTSSAVAADFSGNGEQRSQGIESVIFQIEIDVAIQRHPFAKIEQISVNKSENEILFSAGSIFRIESVELYTDTIWSIVLILTDDVKKEVENLLAYFTKQIGNQPSLLELGVLLSKVGDFERAKRFYLCLRNELPENHYDLGVVYNNLGEIYRKQGHLDTAMKYYKLAIDELTDSFGFFDPWFAVVHSNTAMVYDVRRQFDRALTHYRCALHIIERDSDCSEGELFSIIYNGMAAVFQQKGQLETARKFYEKTLKIELSLLPSNHPSISITYHNIGQLYFQLGDYSSALENLMKALPIMSSTLPNNHLDLASLHASIAAVYSYQSEICESNVHLLEAEQIINRLTLTTNHHSLVNIYRILTIVSRNNEMIDFSIRMHLRLIEAFKAQIPSDQYEIAWWTSNLGRMIFNEGNSQQAFEYQQMSLDIVQQLPHTEKNKRLYSIIVDDFWRAGHSDTAIEHYIRLLNEETSSHSLFAAELHNNLGVIYDHMDNDELALKHYMTSLTYYDGRSETFTDQVATIHLNIAIILERLADYEGARLSICRALSIQNEHDYKFRSRCHVILGQTYVKTSNWTSAREHFEQAIELATQANSHPQVIAKCTRYLQEVNTKITENPSDDFEPIQKSNED